MEIVHNAHPFHSVACLVTIVTEWIERTGKERRTSAVNDESLLIAGPTETGSNLFMELARIEAQEIFA